MLQTLQTWVGAYKGPIAPCSLLTSTQPAGPIAFVKLTAALSDEDMTSLKAAAGAVRWPSVYRAMEGIKRIGHALVIELN